MKFFDKISGKAVEEKIGEYSEVYGEVLLGLHKELEKQSTLLEKHEQQLEKQSTLLEKHEQQFNSREENLHEQVRLKSQVKKLHEQIQQLRTLCVLSYIFAIGVGVVLWMTS